MNPIRIGQIVPSSNITMETEIPALLRLRETIAPERFTFHSSRMRMKHVTKEELAAMDGQSDRCALELSDARVDVMGYACLVAIMSMGHGYHNESARRLHQVTVDNGNPAPVVTSAGALCDGIKAIGAKKVAVVAPYMKPLTAMVVDYIANEGVEVSTSRALEISPSQPMTPESCRASCRSSTSATSMRSCCRPASRCPRSPRSRWSRHRPASRC